MKCEICSKRLETTFMNKIVGTYIVNGKKKKAVCPACQKDNGPKLREKINL
jgi:rubrerythrin